MKILIVTFYLANRNGSELFTLDFAKALKKRGHEVFVHSPVVGLVAEKIKKTGIQVSDNILDFKNENFGIIHAQHNITAILARSVFPETPMIFMAHGTDPELEQAPSVDLGISEFLAVSENAGKNLKEHHLVPEEKIHIVRNFIDQCRFFPKNKVNPTLKNLLVISNHYIPEVKNILESACKELNINLTHIGYPEHSVENVEDFINKADAVVTLGRGAVQAMACARNVFIFDMHGGDGWINEENFNEYRKSSFSGRTHAYHYTKEELKNELKKYNPEDGEKLRNLILAEHSEEKSVEDIIKIYQKVLTDNAPVISQIKEGQLLNEMLFLKRTLKERMAVIQQYQNELSTLKDSEQVELLKEKIELMEQSKFWKLRNIYLKIKDLFVELLGLSLFLNFIDDTITFVL